MKWLGSKYRIIKLVGQGQFGRVFAALDCLSKQLVALKELDQHRFPTQKFLRELRFLVTLNHPNIVSCFGIEHYQGKRYLVLDYYPGGTLRDVIEQGNLNLVEKLKLVADILSGLNYAHHQGIIHCDLKPENILLQLTNTGYQAAISDFGIAKLREEINAKSQELGDTGTPAYMAPERFYGQYSTASDIYAVGVILYELILGERPFSGTYGELMSSHLNQSVTLDNIPFLLRSTITRSLNKLPQKRFPNAQEMLKSLQLAIEVVAIATHDTTPKQVREFQPISPTILSSFSQPITNLASHKQTIYLAFNKQVDYYQQKQYILPDTVQQLQIIPQGCFAFTHSHSLYYLSNKGNQPRLLYQPTSSKGLPKLAFTISPQGNWLALAYNHQLPRLQIIPINLAFYYPKSTISLSYFPSYLIALDSRYGLAITSHPESVKSTFEFFNRRGALYTGFSLPLIFARVISSFNSPYSLLAQSCDNQSELILINLYPWQVSRLTLSITPSFILAHKLGYLVCSRFGEIIVISESGDIVSQLQFTLPGEITAIASRDGFTFLVATYSGSQSFLSELSF